MAAVKVGSKVSFVNTARGMNKKLSGKVTALNGLRVAVEVEVDGVKKTYNPRTDAVTIL